MIARRSLKVYFDGGCRPNPGPMLTAVVAGGRTFLRDDHGAGDNNDAEWLALLHAVQVALEIDATEVTLLGDSALVVQQANGAIPARTGRFAERLAEFRRLAAGFARLRVRRIGRAQNLAGIVLERVHGRL